MVAQAVSKRRRKCSTCRKGNVVSRGKCRRCLTAVWRQIDAGEFTELEAVAKGLLLPAGKPGRPRKKRRNASSPRSSSRTA
jgi:hypothetical protein